MPRPRKSQIALEATPYYHCTSRCVRRAFLCGRDDRSGNDYEHRRGWIEQRMLELAEVYALDVCAYAVMSNHYHIVLHINAEKAKGWTDTEVIERWHRLYAGSFLTQQYLAGKDLYDEQLKVIAELAAEWRERLMSISWFMRALNEDIARQANAEDGCTGRFWEGRFKSQALLDEEALATCLAYVDLNPIRARMADTPESSEFTSAKERIATAQKAPESLEPHQPKSLFPFVGYPRQNMPAGLPFRLQDYLELIDWTGRQIRDDKRGSINNCIPPILERLNIDAEHWVYNTQHFESQFKGLVGTAISIKAKFQQFGYQRTPGLALAELLT
ncbi:transposase, partial [Saccharospirillum alexandrii]|uniref:transposase n=1 Tax=Saccharospirillum alexandrii TaxID=2448477 RepID=UPI0037368E62